MHLAEIAWIVFGIILIVAELFLNGLVIVFFGIAALATGIALSLGMPGGHGIPFALFSALTLCQIFFLRGFVRDIFRGRSVENTSDDDFTGKTAMVEAPFEADGSGGHYFGRVAFRGSHWTACSYKPVKPGQRVVIERRDGSTLFICSK